MMRLLSRVFFPYEYGTEVIIGSKEICVNKLGQNNFREFDVNY